MQLLYARKLAGKDNSSPGRLKALSDNAYLSHLAHAATRVCLIALVVKGTHYWA